MNSLKAYDSGSSSGESSDEDEVPKTKTEAKTQAEKNEEETLHLKKPPSTSGLMWSLMPSTALVSAPVVQPNEKMDDRRVSVC